MKAFWVLSPWLIAGIIFGAEPPAVTGESKFASLDGHKVHYVVRGKGTAPVVLIHGWTGDIDWWRYQVPALEEKFKLVLIDLPGHGKSDAPQVPYSMKRFADAVNAVLREAKIEQAVLVGFSMGAPVMSRFYRDYPEKVQALVSVDGALRRFRMPKEQEEVMLNQFRASDYKENARRFFQSMFPNRETETLRDRIMERSMQTPQHVMVSSFEGMADSDSWELKKIGVPLLVINARAPHWTAEYEQHVRALQPNVEYHTVEGTGHFTMMEKPGEVNRLLVNFLERVAIKKRAEAEEEFLLFNGKDLSGWRLYGSKAPPGPGWHAVDGMLHKAPNEKGGNIITERMFDDYELSWEWRIGPRGNNGVKYFVTEERPSAPGHEYQMIDDTGHPDARSEPRRHTASFYDVLPPAKDKRLNPPGEWNASRLVVRGNRVEHWLNGDKVLEYETGSDAVKNAVARSKFKTAVRFGEKISGHIMLTDHDEETWFRNLRLRELK